MNYFVVSVAGYRGLRVIKANSSYEAIGFYLVEKLNSDLDFIEDIDCELISPDHKIEVSCIGFPIYKTVDEIFKEKEFWDTPSLVCELDEYVRD
jgi:hypothetical protein